MNRKGPFWVSLKKCWAIYFLDEAGCAVLQIGPVIVEVFH